MASLSADRGQELISLQLPQGTACAGKHFRHKKEKCKYKLHFQGRDHHLVMVFLTLSTPRGPKWFVVWMPKLLLKDKHRIKNYVSQLYERTFQSSPWTTDVRAGHRQYHCAIQTTLLSLRSCRCSIVEENDTELVPFTSLHKCNKCKIQFHIIKQCSFAFRLPSQSSIGNPYVRHFQ